MKITLKKLSLAIAGAGMLTIYGCGGSGGTAAVDTVAVNVPITVIDGPIQNAIVCLDKNNNGACDSGEPFAKTDATGKVTLAVAAADVGKYPVIAVVGTDAIDTDTGAVPVPFTMSAPADSTGVVSPLTTMVQQTIASTGASTADAAAVVQAATGITVSLFQDFTTPAAKEAALASTSPNAGDVARMVVITTQQQSAAIGSTVIGTAAADGVLITQADINKAIQKKLLELLPTLVTAMSETSTLGTEAKEAALLAAANALLADPANSALTTTSMATVVAINTQAASTAPVATTAPSAGFNLVSLKFTDASNFFVRIFGSSLTQITPDTSNNTKYVERRYRSNAGTVAQWGAGGDPWRQADLHWTGSAWANCPINFENTSGVRDATGNNAYNYCSNLETGKTNRATFDVSGQTMSSVFAKVLAAGYTNLSIGDNTTGTLSTVFGATTFPTGSSLLYQTSTPLTNALAYYPGSSNVVTQYSALVSAGGDATITAGAACNLPEFSTNGANSTTLEGMIRAMTGTPCVFTNSPAASFTYNGTKYSNQDTTNEAWGNSTVSIGTLGTAPVGTGSAPGFYSGNTKLRVAFKGTGTNPVTYYACKERFNNGSTRNCTAIGTGTYAISTLGDARILTLSNAPAQTSPLNFTKVFVERGGLIYSGYQNKPLVSNNARLNTVAANALFSKLGLPAGNPSTPLALTAASYQGNWEVFDTATPAASHIVSIDAAGGTSCSAYSNGVKTSSFDCAVTFTNLANGDFTLTDSEGGSNNTSTGVANFLTGSISGTYVETAPALTGSFTGARR